MAPSPLDYIPVPESFKLPAHANFGGTSGVAFNSKGNIFVIHRGPMPLMEFDPDGNFIRGFGDGLFDRPHGLRIDAQADTIKSNLRHQSNVFIIRVGARFSCRVMIRLLRKPLRSIDAMAQVLRT